MVEISLSGSGEGPEGKTPRGYSITSVSVPGSSGSKNSCAGRNMGRFERRAVLYA